jgi:hypothetical protein
MAVSVDEGTLERIWSNLMNYLCPRHRTNYRNGDPTDYRIEDLRAEHHRSYKDGGEYFRRHIAELANRHQEIQVEDDFIRLTSFGIDHCGDYVRNWQRDF